MVVRGPEGVDPERTDLCSQLWFSPLIQPNTYSAIRRLVSGVGTEPKFTLRELSCRVEGCYRAVSGRRRVHGPAAGQKAAASAGFTLGRARCRNGPCTCCAGNKEVADRAGAV